MLEELSLANENDVMSIDLLRLIWIILLRNRSFTQSFHLS